MEIERKFLVKSADYKKLGKPVRISQGYLNSSKERTVRVRIFGDQGFITVKSAVQGISRQEYEYEIPIQDAREMLDHLCERPLVEKDRYEILQENHTWEVDEFLGENSGLVIAEIELESESEPFEKPDWIGEEVSQDPKYFNSNLIRFPYSLWEKKI